jgi:tripartite-type tricarboxylate transporter receptor subunit TctC
MNANLASRRASLCVLSLFFAGIATLSNAVGQTYPSDTIRIVVPSSVGTPPDVISRVVATQLANTEGWRIVVENRVGGSQTIGVTDVLRRSSDGYTVLAMSVPLTAISCNSS